MSDSVRPHRRDPTRPRCPWDSPGKNTGVGCHFLLQCMRVKSESEVAQSCPTLSDPMDCSLPGSSIQGIFQARVLEWVAIRGSFIQNTECLVLFLPSSVPLMALWKFPFNPLYNWMLSDCLCSAGFLFFNRSKGKLILQTNSKF